MIPSLIPAIVGGVLELGAKVGDRVLSKSATDIYLGKQNEQLFGPRGLRARSVLPHIGSR